MPAKAQSLLDPGNSSGPVAGTSPAQISLAYTRPAQETKIRNYLFDAFGPYPLVGAALNDLQSAEHRDFDQIQDEAEDCGRR